MNKRPYTIETYRGKGTDRGVFHCGHSVEAGSRLIA